VVSEILARFEVWSLNANQGKLAGKKSNSKLVCIDLQPYQKKALAFVTPQEREIEKHGPSRIIRFEFGYDA
jgi:hypothetical protein